jgi:deoxycytidylate deaminase
MIGPCRKQVVTATIVAPDMRRYVGTNWCANAQTTCPRGNMPTGVGYELCKNVCQQNGHAEVDAIINSKGRARDGVLYLEGHTYACDACKRACADAGLTLVVGAPPPV